MRSILILISIVCCISCNEESPTPPLILPEPDYFPVVPDKYYEYSIEESSTNGTITATRKSYFTSYTALENTEYLKQADTLIYPDTVIVSRTYLRKTRSGVFYFVDTTGLSDIIPPQLLEQIVIDRELRALYLPIEDAGEWSAFRLSLQNLVSLVDVRAFYEGKTELTTMINGIQVTQEGISMRYTLLLYNPVTQSDNAFSAHAVLFEDIGIVKWDGNSVIVNFFTGGGIDFADTSKTVTHTLEGFR